MVTFLVPLLVLTATVCKKPLHEITFNSIVHGIFNEGLLGAGDVLDVGANNGEWACMYACFDSARIVHAVDPSPQYVARMRCNHTNMHKHLYAVASAPGRIMMRSGANQYVTTTSKNSLATRERGPPGNVEVVTLDFLFRREWNVRAAFLHIDVEGYELDVLRGAERVLRNDRPVFSIEIHVHHNTTFTTELILHVTERRYRVYLIPEVCGWERDCRNLLCFPEERLGEFAESPTLDIAARSSALIPVDSVSILRHPPAKAYPADPIANSSVRTWADTISFARSPTFPHSRDRRTPRNAAPNT